MSNVITETNHSNDKRPTFVRWIKNTPIALFAIVMGISGLSLAWEKSQQFFGVSSIPGDALRWVASIIWIILSSVYLAKLIKYPGLIKTELHHPAKLNFFAAISIGLLLVSILWYPSSPDLSLWLWGTGCILHLTFTLITMNIWIFNSNFKIEQITPAWFIPVVGNIIIPVIGVKHAIADINWFFFSIGLISWFILMTMVLYRLFFHEQLPKQLMPTLFILIAPPSVGFLAYVSLNNGILDGAGKILYFLSLFITMLLFTQIRMFSRIPFSLSSWAYSFPLASITIATLEMSGRSDFVLFRPLGFILLLIVTLTVMVLTIKTIHAVFSGKVFISQ
ncbi:SLAC1 anion channel family protein [Providencia huashanensis]|nr:SLAC1 anion channel family protein [Providencia sp. CRE-3FA-0001]